MKPDHFCYWLRGYLELNINKEDGLTPEQLKLVSDHLTLVLKEVPKNQQAFGSHDLFAIDPSIKCELTC